jgi:hypothetical protein
VIDENCTNPLAPTAPRHRVWTSWTPPVTPPSGDIVKYLLYARIPAQELNSVQIPASPATQVAETTDGTTTSLVDPNEYPAGLKVIHFVKAVLGGGQTDKSNEVMTTQFNDPPIANTDPTNNSSYVAIGTTPLVVPSTGNPTLLANDLDPDSPNRTLVGRIVIVSQPAHGALTNPTGNVTASGGFTYTATQTSPRYYGPDSFTYKVLGGEWAPGVPFSPDSAPGTVNIDIQKK